jgi:hypothetical protein
MRHLFAALLLLIASCAQVDAMNLTFTDCGQGEVQSVDVEPCDSDPCSLSKRVEVHGKTTVITTKNAPSASIAMKIRIFGQDLPVPGLDKDVCKITQCPIVAGKPFTIDTRLKIPGIAPSVSI